MKKTVRYTRPVLLLLLLSLSVASLRAAGRLPQLSTARAIRDLRTEQAVQGYPVHLRGIVTFHGNEHPMLYLQDETGGINVELAKAVPGLRAGHMVEIIGATGRGSLLPVVSGAQVSILAFRGIPKAPPISLSDLNPARDDCRWVQIEATVQNAYKESHYTILEAYEGKQRILVRAIGISQSKAGSLIDSHARIRGVLGFAADSAGRPVGVTLWVRGPENISMLSAPPLPPERIPVTPIAELEKNWKGDAPHHRIRIQGTVMPGDKENTLIIQDKSGRIPARPLFVRAVTSGDEVDLVGFADLGSARPAIINAVYLRIKARATTSRQEKGLPVLTTIAEIRNLDAKEAERGYPVRIKGTITYHHPQLSMTFIQNDSNAIYLQSLDPMITLDQGSEYEVDGFTAPGDFSPIVVRPRFRLIRKALLPPARYVSHEQLARGGYDCVRVQVGGVVRSIRQVGNRWCLELFDRDRGIQVWTPGLPESLIRRLRDARILVQGICSIQTSSWGAISGFKVNVSSSADIEVVEPAGYDPFEAPLRMIQDVFRSPNQAHVANRVRIKGTVLHQQPGSALYVKDASGSISIQINDTLPVNANDLVTVSGYPMPGNPMPTLAFSYVRRLSTSRPPEPRLLEDLDIPHGDFHGDLVRVQARLVDQWQNDEARFFLLQDTGRSNSGFEAFLESTSGSVDRIRNESLLELTGIYLLKPKTGQKYGFQLLLRTPEDIRIIRHAPWWTREHIYWAFAFLVLLIVSASWWAWMLKRRVNRQTAIIQHRFEVEAALQKKYRDLFERSNDIVFACDETGRIRSINPAGTRILGYSLSQFLELDPRSLIEPGSLSGIIEWMEKKEKGAEAPHLECELIAQDGHRVIVEVSGDLLQTDGIMTGAQGIARDITERKHAEEALRISEQKLLQGQKLESIGRLAGGIAHDFNNILSAILGYAELSMEEILENHPVRGNMEQIVKASRRARDLVQQILAFSRKLERKRHPVYLQAIIDEALRLLKPAIPSSIEISIDADPSCSPVMADATQMHQIVVNLATNAAHAIGASGGSIRIELERVELKTRLSNAFPELMPGTYSRLTVSDTGPGMSSEIQKRIFEPYFTTKSVGEGSGLGLAVVHGIVQSHGGAILVISSPGDGACFQIYLPCCEEKAQQELQTEDPEPNDKAQNAKGRVLLVDDEESIVRLGEKSLRRIGYEVTGETLSTKALESFARNPMKFDLLITDQTMPRMTGTVLAQEIWKIRPDMPVILSTGFSEQITCEKATRLGFHRLLNKPYTIAELTEAVQSVREAVVISTCPDCP